MTALSRSTRTAGFWSAILATVFSGAYILAQIAEWLGWLGSSGGPESSSTPRGLAFILTPSILLGSAFVVLMLSIHESTPSCRRIWSHAAVAFATAYATLISIVYFVQLTVIAPHLARGDMAGLEVFRFVPFNSFLYGVDILGYSFMSIATLFAARALVGPGLERTTRWWLTANGLILPFLVGQMYFHPLIWIASLWAVTFPASTTSLALLFRRSAVA